MTASHRNTDWADLKRRLVRCQALADRTRAGARERIDRILHERAARLASRGKRRTDHVPTSAVLVFRLGGERLGLELSLIEQVFPNLGITPIPGGADHLLGVANLRGSIRSVVDLHRLVGVPAGEPNGGYVVLARVDGTYVGLWVEAIENVCQLALGELVPVESASTGACTHLSVGISSNRVIVLDPHALVKRLSERRTSPETAVR